MRLSVFLEAWVQLVLQEGSGSSQGADRGIEFRKGVTGLITYHKVAPALSQPPGAGCGRCAPGIWNWWPALC